MIRLSQLQLRNGGCRRLLQILCLTICLQCCEPSVPFSASLDLGVLCGRLLILRKGGDTVFFFAAADELLELQIGK